ncbi:hypothetical protein JHK86_018605 [Glycine max]|nr:hypothetical protein JHK86_018605 [Glycine max]
MGGNILELWKVLKKKSHQAVGGSRAVKRTTQKGQIERGQLLKLLLLILATPR